MAGNEAPDPFEFSAIFPVSPQLEKWQKWGLQSDYVYRHILPRSEVGSIVIRLFEERDTSDVVMATLQDMSKAPKAEIAAANYHWALTRERLNLFTSYCLAVHQKLEDPEIGRPTAFVRAANTAYDGLRDFVARTRLGGETELDSFIYLLEEGRDAFIDEPFDHFRSGTDPKTGPATDYYL